MSDSAFKSAPFAAYTTEQLQIAVEANGECEQSDKINAEIARRAARDAGDVSVMTPGERLRHVQRFPR